MRAPKEGSKKYRKVLDAGCGGYWIGNPTSGYDFDCDHGYDWDCDCCPIVIEVERCKQRMEGEI